MRRLFSLVAAVLSARCAPPVGEPPAGERRVVLVHIADLHSHLFAERLTLTARDVTRGLGSDAGETAMVGGAARLATVVDGARAHADAVVTLDAGDVFEGTAVYTLFGGVPEMSVLDALGVDARAFGNHDFAPGLERLRALQAEAPRTAWLAANLEAEASGLVTPFTVVERGGVRVLVVGLGRSPRSAPDVAACAAEVQRAIDANGDADVRVVLSHLGSDLDASLVPLTAGVDVVLGGHTHDVLFPPRAVRDCGPQIAGRRTCTPRAVPVLHSGAYGRYAGKVTIAVSPGERRPMVTGVELVPITDSIDERADVTALLEPYRRRMERAGLGLPIALAPKAVSRTATGGRDSPLGNFVTHAMRVATTADVAVINSTGLRDDLPAGELAAEDVYRVLPFEDELVTVTMTGREVLAAFEEARADSCDRSRTSQAQLDGATLRFGCEPRALEVVIGGVPVDEARTYQVATVSFLTEAGRWFAPPPGATVESRGLLRDAVLEAIGELGPCSDAGDPLPCIDAAAGAAVDRRIEWH